MEVVTILFGSFAILLLIGAPITIALGVSSMISLVYLGNDLVYLVQVAYSSVDSFPIMALPAFILAGALMEYSGISRRLVTLAEAIAGPATGGLAGATVLACLFFGAISGSGPATTAAVGMLMIPAMINRGYDKGYASAITASSGGLGVVIPPSIPMVIYGVSGNQSIAKLFIAGFIPGILIAAGLATVNYFLCRKKGYVGSQEGWSVGKIIKAVKEGIWSIMAPVVILGGIYTGFFTPTEAAVVAIFYTLFVGIFIHKELKLGGGSKSLEACTWLTGRVLLIMFTARAFGRLLVQYRIPEIVANGMLAMTSNLYIIWVLVIAFLIFVGMFMETLATIMILTPVLLPVMMKLGVDPIHFGIVFVCCCEIGFETPPLGENLFIASGIGDTSIEDISLKAIPFSIVEISAVFLIAFIPALSLWFPKLLGY
ncbi:MAG: C4-dicarboxylate ABC transporter permease [Desulfuromonadales bacterium C00003093]|nr:MAG: C4-dicarboxylate ABC transporter permease [Desulfuromonadales bacterium C00003093]